MARYLKPNSLGKVANPMQNEPDAAIRRSLPARAFAATFSRRKEARETFNELKRAG
jgi:hypothetical protein